MRTDQILSQANAAVTQTSVGVQIGDQTIYSVEVNFSSGTLNGTLTLEASVTGTNYATVAGSSVSITSGESHVYNVSNAGYGFFKVKWTPSSGTGTITATSCVKEPTNRF